MQRRGITRIQSHTSVRVRKSFLEVSLLVPGDGSKQVVARERWQFCAEPIMQRYSCQYDHATNDINQVRESARPYDFDGRNQTSPGQNSHHGPNRVSIAVTNEKGDISGGIKQRVDTESDQRITVPKFSR